jgi:hypothetical protein
VDEIRADGPSLIDSIIGALQYYTGNAPGSLKGSVMLEPEADAAFLESGFISAPDLTPEDFIPYGKMARGLLGLAALTTTKPIGKAAAKTLIPKVVKLSQKKVVEPVVKIPKSLGLEASTVDLSDEVLEILKQLNSQ